MKKQYVLVVLCAFLATSCAAIQSKRKVVDGKGKGQRSKWIAKSQYDALLEKYNDLKEKHDSLKEEKMTQQHNLLDELNQKTPSLKKKTAAEVKGSKPVIYAETVDVDLVNDEVTDYIKAKQLVASGSLDPALQVFQRLERSENPQMRVRAKFQTGMIFMKKRKFDLALQVHETIVGTYAFSGIVIDSLKSAYRCAEELGLEEKKIRFKSMLEDFFGLKV
jgi:hypothetical protein